MRDREYNFRKWIEAGFKNYGEDSWFFIRELAQNSRDAGATRIDVKIQRTANGDEALIFDDNGKGLSYEDSKEYLFRLYASSKTNEKSAAGFFGIGFWTVLKFNPQKIIIESWYKKDEKPWGVMVNTKSHLTTHLISSNLKHKGTRIILIRSIQEASDQEFHKKVRAALKRYCSYLRQNTSKAEPLPVYFGGEKISEIMRLPGPISLSFKEKYIEGSVGLGIQPSVQIYSRGLPVWEGTSLDELSHLPPSSEQEQNNEPEIGIMEKGLAPVFLLNGNHLEVNISRKRVIDNRNLQKLRKTAERKLAQLVESTVDSIAPRSFFKRISMWFKRGKNSILSSVPIFFVLSLVVILPLEYILIRTFIKDSVVQKSRVLSLIEGEHAYNGASVGNGNQDEIQLNLLYTPSKSLWFKILSANEYHLDTGFLPTGSSKNKILLQENECQDSSEEAIDVKLKVEETGRIFLPLPLGYQVNTRSITIEGKSIPLSQIYSSGEVVIQLNQKGLIRYQCCPIVQGAIPKLTMTQKEQYIRLPDDLEIPEHIEKYIYETQFFNPKNKIKKAFGIISQLLKYDTSQETLDQYNTNAEKEAWLQKILTIGKGDCDIINGLLVLLLRKMDIPAQLVLGVIGREGRLAPGFHAWCEYYDDNLGWQMLDATFYTNGTSGESLSSDRPIPEGSIDREPLTSDNIIRAKPEKRTIGWKWVFTLPPFIFLLPFGFYFLFKRLKRSKRLYSPIEYQQMKEDLASMILYELLHPGGWGIKSNIRDYPIIPTINENIGPISLEQALKLGDQGKLFTYKRPVNAGSETDTLFEVLKSASVPILDSSSAFAPLVKILPNTLHLHQIFDLKLISPEEITQKKGFQLLADVNQRLKRVEKGVPLCFWGQNIGEISVFDADLLLLPSLADWGIPSRFICVNPNCPNIKEMIRLYPKNPKLAQFRMIHFLFQESNLLPAPAEIYIAKISGQIIGELKRQYREMVD